MHELGVIYLDLWFCFFVAGIYRYRLKKNRRNNVMWTINDGRSDGNEQKKKKQKTENIIKKNKLNHDFAPIIYL